MKRFLIFIALFITAFGFSQNAEQINWMSPQQLSDSLVTQPKKTLIYFYADWCAYCKKMEKHAFSNSKVIKKINNSFYAVKMNAETTDTIHFGSQQFINKEAFSKRRGTHEFALLLGSRKDRKFSLPVILLFDESFKLIRREFNYLTTEKMLAFIAD
ncbi:thioredoxin fold domain-containing protein [Mesonia sp. K7]|uniref:thioredoxin family protein n=1 Tax=Mesonia sp. K7 TaxID=2218606 RepID=UPI000DA799D3|nr:thioredoxin fold domain-containing protein [Mesonia sp. K7]PZD77452.1 thioredoxin family protein [Mesonia sp. K7]